MLIQHLQIKNFRCFKDISLPIEKSVVLITGENGSGKSSVLEAIHYGCYLRSFRTHLPRDLIHFDANNFFIKMAVQYDLLDYNLQVGFSGKKRVVKIDEKSITSYKDLAHKYRIITITEDDISIIKGGPEIRRLFIDQAVSLQLPDFFTQLKKYRHILETRNALLDKGSFQSDDVFMIWTHQLWEQSSLIQGYRRQLLDQLQEGTNELLNTWFDESLIIRLQYQQKKMNAASFDIFSAHSQDLFLQEKKFRRSLFGAHLDDIAIEFCYKTSRSFASRGQQKLIIMLLKIAQMRLIMQEKGPAIFLLDDFMTDFDPTKSKILFDILQTLNSQLFFTSPSPQGLFEGLLLTQNAQHIKLTI